MTSGPRSSVTSLWRAVVRFDAAKKRPAIGLRNALGVMLPVAIGVALGSPARGMAAAMGALNVAVGDGADSYLHRARRLLIATFLCALSVFAGAALGGTYVISAVLAAGAFAAGMTVALGQAEANLGLMTLVVLIVFSARPVPWPEALSSALLAAGGGLLQSALSLALWPFQRNQPEQRALSALYLELGRAAAATTPATEAPPATAESTEAQRALDALDARDSVDAERYLALLSEGERIRLTLVSLARLRMRLAREPGTAAVTVALNRLAAVASQSLRQAGEALVREGQRDPLPEWSLEIHAAAAALRGACRTCNKPVVEMFADARYQADALAGQLRAVLEISAHTTLRGLRRFELREAAQPWKLRFASVRSRVAAALRPDSGVFRHAVRLAICVGAGEIFARGLHAQRPYWVPMTIALVLKPDYTATFSRGLQRLLGTLAGLLLATALIHFLDPAPVAQVALVGIFAFLLRGYGLANYGILAIGITALVVFQSALEGVSPWQVMQARGWNTLAGGAIALLAYRLWPTWERTQVPEALARMLDAYRAYFRAVRDGYLEPGARDAALDQTRLGARMARSNLEASIGRMRAEPGTSPGRIARFGRILANSHRFIHAAMALDAGLVNQWPLTARDAFRALTDHIDVTLYFLAASLRGSRIEAAHLPDLREDHNNLVESSDPQAPHHALATVECDRAVNSLNTLAGEILALQAPVCADGSTAGTAL